MCGPSCALCTSASLRPSTRCLISLDAGLYSFRPARDQFMRRTIYSSLSWPVPSVRANTQHFMAFHFGFFFSSIFSLLRSDRLRASTSPFYIWIPNHSIQSHLNRCNVNTAHSAHRNVRARILWDFVSVVFAYFCCTFRHRHRTSFKIEKIIHTFWDEKIVSDVSRMRWAALLSCVHYVTRKTRKRDTYNLL